jgi:RNA polymerase sigma-70 factor (ECF subfamily)
MNAKAIKIERIRSRNPLSTCSYGLRLAMTQPNPDYIRASAVARENTMALSDLYERHNQLVYSVCLGMTRNIADAEDLTQEVFVQLLNNIGSFRGESKFSTWLYRVTVNQVLMHFRREQVRGSKVTDGLEAKMPIIRQKRGSYGAQFANRIDLDLALAQLPSGSRSVFELFDIAGYKHDEIANLLGCTPGTSKSQLHKARRKLRRLLTPAC